MNKIFCVFAAALLGLAAAGHAADTPVGNARVILPAARDFNAPGGLPLRKLMDIPMRDPNITLGPDGNYYLVGTTDPAPGYTTIGANDLAGQMWTVNDGIRMWKSPDLIHWQSLGLIWSLDRDGTWAHWWTGANPGSAVWAPEIHYLKGTYWIPYCTKLKGEGLHLGAGLLRSVSGKPEGPYRDVQTTGPLGPDDDASLFQDEDGKVYFLFGGYKIARMKDNMSGLAEEPRDIKFDTPPGWGEGIYLVKVKGKYIFINSGTAPITPDLPNPPPGQTTYDCFSAVSPGSIYGPYTTRYRAIPHDGHNNLFQDKKGRWWSTYFGSDPWAPFSIGASGRPAVLPVTISPEGTIRADRTSPRPVWRYRTTPPAGDWTATGDKDQNWKTKDQGWETGGGAFGDPAVTRSGNVTDIGTVWTTGSLWLRRTFLYNPNKGQALQNPGLYLRHSGPIDIYLNGRKAVHIDGSSDDYLTMPLPASVRLRTGVNTLAVQSAAGSGSAYIDVGIIDLPRTPVAVSVVPTSELTGQTWRYTTQTPAQSWRRREFDDAAWQTGTALFGNAVPSINTAGTTSDIWLRRPFTLTKPLKIPQLRVFHDEDAEVYIDGQLAASPPGYAGSYVLFPISSKAARCLTPGTHTLAVHCHQTIGGQGIDIGLIDLR